MKSINEVTVKDEKYGLNFHAIVLLDENENVIDSINVPHNSNKDVGPATLAMLELLLRNSGNKRDEYIEKIIALMDEMRLEI